MATKKTEPDGIVISRKDAEQIVELFRNVEAADAIYKTCQSDLFRQHVHGCYKAAKVDAAYQRLKQALGV